ncbi:hypothetical protein, partial [Klebsiella pneumoniae]|uniref:hypothetical protein n=1 Tax=Klebsiella pneumoniae TaxID=573 RepID=UPI001952C526
PGFQLGLGGREAMDDRLGLLQDLAGILDPGSGRRDLASRLRHCRPPGGEALARGCEPRLELGGALRRAA